MLNNRYRITLGGKSYYPEFQTDSQYAAAWNRVLARAYGREQGVCGCPQSVPVHANECRLYAGATHRFRLQRLCRRHGVRNRRREK